MTPSPGPKMESERVLQLTPGVEKAMADDGILLLKYWLEVSPGAGDVPGRPGIPAPF
jgi:polyphosphate kinase 2 (PPK2 family)